MPDGPPGKLTAIEPLKRNEQTEGGIKGGGIEKGGGGDEAGGSQIALTFYPLFRLTNESIEF